MANPGSVTTKEQVESKEESRRDLPRRLEDLMGKVSRKGGNAHARGRRWLEIGRIQRVLENFTDAIKAFKQAQQALKAVKTDEGQRDGIFARADEALGLVLRNRGEDLAKAHKILVGLDGLEGSKNGKFPETVPVIDHYKGLVAFKNNDQQEARRLLLRAVKGARKIGNPTQEALALDSLSEYYRHYGEAGRSEAYLFKALEIKRQLKDSIGQAVTLDLLGRLCLQFERFPSAQHYFEENLTLVNDLKDSGRLARTMGFIGKAMVGQGKLNLADRKLKMGLMFAKRHSGATLEADLLRELSEVARRSGKMTEARKRLDLASRHYLEAKEPGEAAITDCLRANIHFEEGNPKAAFKLLKTATDVLRKHKRSTELVPALSLMAQVQREVGERTDAIQILTEASEVARNNHLFRELETVEREKFRLEHTRPDSGGDENSIRFFREFCLYGLRGTVKEYRVIREIGQGTTGVVFEALDESLGRSVAVKMLKPELSGNSELVSRFRRELEAVGLVDHPSVMKIYACGRNDDRFFYVTDYLPGPSLRTYLETNGPLPPDRGLSVITRVAEAVAAVHRAGVVHRDLKPGNILLGDQDQPVVVDFGISGKRGKLPSAEEGAVMGTFHYMALEHMDPRSKPALEWDIYSLGVTFYELLTGRLPFPAKTFPELVKKLKAGKIAPIRVSGKALSTAVRELITRMLDKAPAKRPSAAEVADTLKAETLKAETTKAR